MTLESLGIDRFPLKTSAPRRQTPGQEGADRFLRAVTPEDIDRLMREDEETSHGRLVGAPATGPVHVPNSHMNAEYPSEGYNRPDRSYEDPTGQYGHRPGEEHPDLQGEYWLEDPRRYRFTPSMLFGSLADDDEDEYDEPEDPEWSTYHVGVRPRGMPPGSPTQAEIRVHRLESPYDDHDTEEAWSQLMLEHPHNFHEDNPNRSHDIIFMHPESHHDEWQRDLTDEDQTFQNRIAQHGLERESPDVLGHRAYRHEDPNGGVHRLWRNTTTYIEGPRRYEGSGWHTSYYNPQLSREQQAPWLHHMDNEHEDSLGSALDQIDHQRAMTR